MEKYFKDILKKFVNVPIGAQALAWFISFKFSEFLLYQIQNVGVYFFNIILQFILSLIIMLVILVIFDQATRSRDI